MARPFAFNGMAHRWYALALRLQRHDQEQAEFAAREAARSALQVLFICVLRQMAVAQRVEWSIAAARALPANVLSLILEFAG